MVRQVVRLARGVGVNIEQVSSHYPMSQVRPGIVHIGLGAFHRAHQAVYVEKCLRRSGGGHWGIVAANVRSNAQLVERLNQAGNRYHVIEFKSSEDVVICPVRSIVNTIFAGNTKAELLNLLAEPDIKIVTLTVTEKGYGLHPAKAELNRDDPAVVHDLEDLEGPLSIPGLLVAALARRRLAKKNPFTVLSCDNMPHNGRRVKAAVLEMAAAHSNELRQWIEAEVAFPCSMVDRIVPAVTEDDLALAARKLDIHDVNAVFTESFSQWVIEDNFCRGRPEWELDGVEMVDDVAPFEVMKLRLLNGSHSLLAYLGSLSGLETVDQAIRQPALRRMVQLFHAETRPSISVDTDLELYCASLLLRFENDNLHHRLAQIATDGSQKIPQRWLEHLQQPSSASGELPRTEQALAAWILFMSGVDGSGDPLTVNDPLQEIFMDIAVRCSEDYDQWVKQCFSVESVFSVTLRENAALQDRVARYLEQLHRCQSREAVVAQLGHWVS